MRLRNDSYERYAVRWEHCAARLRERPRCVAALQVVSKALTVLFYGAYAALLVAIALIHPSRAIPLVLVPGVAFAAVSLFRRYFNAPRPYECCSVRPLLVREGSGQSFPSRHAFSAFAIAASWFALSAPVAIGLLGCACAVGVLRVVGGVHFPRDVIAGAAIGMAAGIAAAAAALMLP